jgi:hypothetical protein
MMIARYSAMALVCAALVAGCSDKKNRFAFDGKYFRTKVAKVDKQRDVFTVTVKDVSQSFEGARAAALHGANGYCVSTYGSSDIDWVVGPDTPVDQLRIVDNTLTYQGTCPQSL